LFHVDPAIHRFDWITIISIIEYIVSNIAIIGKLILNEIYQSDLQRMPIVVNQSLVNTEFLKIIQSKDLKIGLYCFSLPLDDIPKHKVANLSTKGSQQKIK
jgi:hypothetical protein